MFVLVEAQAVSCDTNLQNIMGLIKFLLNVVRFVVPLVLIVLGTFDLFKAVTAGKDEDIKKKQQVLIKRVIAGVIVFLVPTIVSILMGWLGNSEWKTCWDDSENTFTDLFKVK